MSLTAQTIQLILAAVVLCLSAVQVKPQSQARDSTIRGVVVYSDTGRPLRHARISLSQVNGGLEQIGPTDLRGRFVFPRLPAGKYLLTVEAPGILKPKQNVPQRKALIPDGWFTTPSELVTEVTVNGTDSTDVKIRAVRGGVITGRVVTEDDQPLIYADIKLLRRENGKWVPERSTWYPFGEEKENRKTDVRGVYRIAGLPSGDYLVRVSEPFLMDDRIPGEEDSYYDGSLMVAYYPAATRVKDAQTVSVVAGSEATGIDIRTTERAPHTLIGTVTIGADKMPASGVEVTIELSDEIGYTKGARETGTRTDLEGKWRVPGVPAGDYIVTIGGSMRVASGEDIRWIESPHKRTRVRIQDKKINVLNTTLSLGAQVEGRVTLNGKPPGNKWSFTAGVDLDDKSAAANRTEDALDESHFRTGWVRDRGTFEITAIPAGTYRFQMLMREADAAEVYVKSVTRKGIDLMQSPFKLTEGSVFDEVVITLATDLPSVEGQVALADEKQSPSDVTMIIAPANDLTRRFGGGPRTVQPDAQGKFTFSSAPGEYFISAVTTAHYKKLLPEISYEYFDKNAEKFLRLKLRAGEKTKGLTLQVADK